LGPYTYTHTVTLTDGSVAKHTAEALAFHHEADGVIVVLAACCGLVGGTLCDSCNGIGCDACGGRGNHPIRGIEDTRSRHTFYDLGMPVSDGNGGILPPIDPQAEVEKHVQDVAQRHATRHKAKDAKLTPLMRPKKPVPSPQVADTNQPLNPPADPGRP
jgi:hypothetical protein